MNKYEIMFIVNPTLDEASIKKVADDMKNIILNAKGEIVEEQDMGQRDLAYEINKHKKGYYFLYVEQHTSHQNMTCHVLMRQECEAFL